MSNEYGHPVRFRPAPPKHLLKCPHNFLASPKGRLNGRDRSVRGRRSHPSTKIEEDRKESSFHEVAAESEVRYSHLGLALFKLLIFNLQF